MPSLRDGDYRLVGAIQGSSPEHWYRQCIDADAPYRPDGSYALSCDCPAWINNQSGNRICKHTTATSLLLNGTGMPGMRPVQGDSLTITTVVAMQPLIQGLIGEWRLEEREAPLAGKPYRYSLLELKTSNGQAASAFVALNQRSAPHIQDISAAMAAWAGWAVAAEIARLNGFGQVGMPPDTHYRFQRGGRTASAGEQRYGIHDLLTIGDQTNLGDGRSPRARAEETLRLFLGPLYADLQRQGFLDVNSKRYPGRVYRVRLEPERRYDRRVRVFEHGRYVRDLCIVRRDRMTPVQDGFLTVFLGLLSDEQHVLRVVGSHNVFSPYSDSNERDPSPPVWQPVQAAA